MALLVDVAVNALLSTAVVGLTALYYCLIGGPR
jgi:hypothetical protein